MSSFTVSALCAALSMCYTPSQLTRQSSSFVGTPDVQRIVVGSTYQIAAQGTSFTAGQSWTLSSSSSVIANQTCTYLAAANDNQCIFNNVFTASTTPGTTITYTAHDTVSNNNITFSMITAAAVPAQPSLANSNETHYIINSAADAESCVLISSPSTLRYEPELPALWTGVWTEKPDYVTHVMFGISADSQTVSGLWSSVAAAGDKHDFHAFCYNGVGRSMPYSVYNLVAVGSSTAPSATIVSSSSTSATSFQVTFQSPVSSGVRGFYPDNVAVQSACSMAYGRAEALVSLSALRSGMDHVFVVSAVDLSVELPFSISCTVDGVANTAVQGRIAAVSGGLSSSSGTFSPLSSSSAPVGFLSSSSEGVVLLSSSSAAPVLLSSSSAAPVLLSSSSAAPIMLSSSEEAIVLSSSSSGASASTGQVESSSVILSTGASVSSTGASEIESSSAAPSAVSSSAAVASSSTAAASSSSSSTIRSASSSAVVSPIENVPEGTVSVTFGIDIPEGGITEAVVGALHSDISSNIAVQANSTTLLIKPFVIVTVGTMTSSNRRLLSEWVAVSFMVLGNITTVTGGQTGAPFNAMAAATSVTTALSSGTFVSTETAAFGVSVPQQTVDVLPVISPSRPSSSTGSDESSTGVEEFGEEDDSSSSGISDGAIAGAVVGSILGAIVLLAIVGVAARSGAFNKCMTHADPVTQANANDFHNKGPLPIGSFEDNVEVGYAEQPVRIHTDSPLAGPMRSHATPAAEEMVYSNGHDLNDANDVQVTIDTRE